MKSVHILFPCSPLEGIRKVDEEFQQEHAAAIKAGLKVFFFDHDHLVKRGEVIFNEYPKGTIVILRGWMLTLEQYTVLHAEFCKEDTRMLTSPQQYESMHYWPKAHEKYPLLRSLSPRCFWTYDKAFSVKHIKQFFGGDPIIVKDHVKSAKGAENAMFIKDSADKREVWTVIENMIKERGNLFQRGIVFKQRVNIRKDDDGNNIEFRAFFYGGHNLSVKPNGCKWDYLRAQMQNTKMPLTDLIRQLAGLDEGFYTVDLALSDDAWVVLECGDGQVSGLATGEDAMLFYERLRFRTMGEPLNEHSVEDSYPVHFGYAYVVDGKVISSPLEGRVSDLKHALNAKEVTTCDIFGRAKQEA
jgi:hypothetical protein